MPRVNAQLLWAPDVRRAAASMASRTDATVTLWEVHANVGHHSNGQDGCFFKDETPEQGCTPPPPPPRKIAGSDAGTTLVDSSRPSRVPPDATPRLQREIDLAVRPRRTAPVDVRAVADHRAKAPVIEPPAKDEAFVLHCQVQHFALPRIRGAIEFHQLALSVNSEVNGVLDDAEIVASTIQMARASQDRFLRHISMVCNLRAALR